MGRQAVGVEGIVPTAAVKVEPAALPPMISAPAFSHFTPISNGASQGIPTLQTSSSSRISQEANIANDSVQEHGPIMYPFRKPIRPPPQSSWQPPQQSVTGWADELNSFGRSYPDGTP
ncbi:unnamed protein product [Urochloa humidicola]